ncbi:MAG: hypothetical protein AB1601_04735 [Planctomycetota bacterium]
MARTLTWDAENRLVRVEPTPGQYSPPPDGARKMEFGYDYLGRRVQKCVLVWDPTLNGGNGEWSDSAGLGAYTRRFVWSGWLTLVELEDDTGVPPVDTVLRAYTWGLDLSGTLDGLAGGR